MMSLTSGQWCFDAAVAAGFIAIGQYELRFLPDSGYQEGPLALNTALSFLCAAPLIVRPRLPFPALAMSAAPLVIASLITVHALTFWGMGVPLAVLCYSVARWSQHSYAWLLASGVATLVLVTYGIHATTFSDVETYVFSGVLFGLACLSGAVIARLTKQRLALDAAMVQLRAQEHDRQSRALTDERARIAREMHDVMAHGISVMVVQAGSARLELAPDATKARESLLVVERTGREVLSELRHTVGLLRDHDTAAHGDPTPNLSALPALVKSMKAAGLDIRLEVEEDLDLDPGRAVAVYRVVQEALTNTLRHAGPGKVSVRVTRPDDLRIEVINSCAGPVPTFSGGGGSGVAGMRERVGMFGGELVAGPVTHGFAVRARIPMGQQQ